MTIQEIQQLVADAYGVTALDLMSRRRDRAVITPRFVAIWLCRHATPHSLPEIGRAFGRRDHTTVMNALARIEARLVDDESFAIRAGELRQAVEVVA